MANNLILFKLNNYNKLIFVRPTAPTKKVCFAIRDKWQTKSKMYDSGKQDFRFPSSN